MPDKFLHVSRLTPHPANIREDLGDLDGLAASIRQHGVLQPIVVQPRATGGGSFLILAGHRRYAAAKRAGLDTVPVTIREDDGDAGKVIEIMLVENLQRTDLNPMEKAEAMGALRNRGYTTVAIGKAVGVTDATVSTYLALLELDASAREKVRRRELSAADAVTAVRAVRRKNRASAGQKSRSEAMAATWEPDHFTWHHALAKKAAGMCAAREHGQRRRIGKVACGECWETVIRVDERTVMTVLGEDAGAAASRRQVLEEVGRV